MKKFVFGVLSILALSSLAGGAPLLLGSPPFHSLLQSLSESRLRGPADLECDACKIVVTALQQLLLTNSSENEIVDVITKLCIALQIEDQNVCTLGVLEFKVWKDGNLWKLAKIIVSPLLLGWISDSCGWGWFERAGGLWYCAGSLLWRSLWPMAPRLEHFCPRQQATSSTNT